MPRTNPLPDDYRIQAVRHRGYVRRQRPGREATSGYAWLRVVVEPELRDALVGQSDKEKVTLSEVVRRACRAYVKL